jgi:hypothetical protein
MATATALDFEEEAPGDTVTLIPSNYREYYAVNVADNSPIEFVMDVFKAVDRNEDLAIKSHRELNEDIVTSRDTMPHGYVSMSKTDDRLLILHRITFYPSPMGTPPNNWQDKIYAMTGDTMGNQLPQTVIWPTRLLEPIGRIVKVQKTADLIATLMGTDLENVPPVEAATPATEYDEIQTRYGMYVPGKYLTMLLEKRLRPKEALIMILTETELTSQGDTDVLLPLIDWLWVAVTRMDADKASASSVARSSSPEVPLMDPELVHKQTQNVKKELPA